MKKKWISGILILLVMLALVVARNWFPRGRSERRYPLETTKSPVDRETGFDRRVSLLRYSNHARCRMKCRMISEKEVEEIMLEGRINYVKSDLGGKQCPRYALEGMTEDSQHVRIVYAQCVRTTTVVTVIDLDREWLCDCPNTDRKYDNRK